MRKPSAFSAGFDHFVFPRPYLRFGRWSLEDEMRDKKRKRKKRRRRLDFLICQRLILPPAIYNLWTPSISPLLASRDAESSSFFFVRLIPISRFDAKKTKKKKERKKTFFFRATGNGSALPPAKKTGQNGKSRESFGLNWERKQFLLLPPLRFSRYLLAPTLKLGLFWEREWCYGFLATPDEKFRDRPFPPSPPLFFFYFLVVAI